MKTNDTFVKIKLFPF